MTRRRWIADEVFGHRAALTGTHADHLIRVLRARVGQEFDIVAHGVAHLGRIVAISEGRVEFELGQEISAPASDRVTILLSIFKFDRMEWAIEKCTELGVARIVPVVARRTDAHLASAAVKRVDRWRRIAMQAAEQSRRTCPPEISDPVKLQDSLQIPKSSRIVLAETETHSTLRTTVASNADKEIVLAIGPEGGWAPTELEAFEKQGWAMASLGPTILRAETAAIAATAITMDTLAGEACL